MTGGFLCVLGVIVFKSWFIAREFLDGFHLALHLGTLSFSNTMWAFETVQTNERFGTKRHCPLSSCEFNWVAVVGTNNTGHV